jgi:hypothetical protein
MKPLHWIGSSLADLRAMPDAVREEAGYAIYLAQLGDKAVNAVPMVWRCQSSGFWKLLSMTTVTLSEPFTL